MKNWIAISFITLLMIRCGETKEDIEKRSVLSQEQFASLLIDIYLAEAVADNLPFVKDSSIKYFLPQEQKLLRSSNISDTVLQQTYRYYYAHPKEFEKVYDIIIDSLTLREQRTREPK